MDHDQGVDVTHRQPGWQTVRSWLPLHAGLRSVGGPDAADQSTDYIDNLDDRPSGTGW